ncbi:hypothetical protein LTR97_003720 [Elasticomyces elasticus]|uniref:Tyrosinase copper-binding domain-containing protein n=1 Tax=Elasticomyces elasticus TaxID=574655 RepID=A0AAN7VUG8_9PEZI|nr:hypothetical protein LTR97_003720 [Elasticomyces elasticus]
MAVRREWGALSTTERGAYIDAVHCMINSPSHFAPGEVPGARNRFDDFAAIHINKTNSIHLDGIFLSWHRNFVWIWETALREECGYAGYQPYWNWALWCDDLGSSPLFDGSSTSLSGNGAPDNSSCPIQVANGETLPCGTGGGCVTSGPFKNLTNNLGPISFPHVYSGLPANWTAHNPRCFKRDLSSYIATRYGNQTALDALMNTTTIEDFQNTMSGADINLGPHGGGHFALGPAMDDFFASPQDPAFFLHHGMVDRMWTLWQDVDERSRRYSLQGTSTIFNGNSTPNVTLSTKQDWGNLGRVKETEELLSPREYDFCYTYE